MRVSVAPAAPAAVLRDARLRRAPQDEGCVRGEIQARVGPLIKTLMGGN